MVYESPLFCTQLCKEKEYADKGATFSFTLSVYAGVLYYETPFCIVH